MATEHIGKRGILKPSKKIDQVLEEVMDEVVEDSQTRMLTEIMENDHIDMDTETESNGTSHTKDAQSDVETASEGEKSGGEKKNTQEKISGSKKRKSSVPNRTKTTARPSKPVSHEAKPKKSKDAASKPKRRRSLIASILRKKKGKDGQPLRVNMKKRGENGIREIKAYQKHTGNFIQRSALERVVREISADLSVDHSMRWTRDAISVIHSGAEDFLALLFENGGRFLRYRQRVTMGPQELLLFLENDQLHKLYFQKNIEKIKEDIRVSKENRYNVKLIPGLEI